MTQNLFSRRYLLPGTFALACGLLLTAACGQQASAPPVTVQTPKQYLITPNDLPPPGATPSANNGPSVVSRPEGAGLHVPTGFSIAEWAANLENPRFLTVAPNGDVFVAESGCNRVTVLRDTTGSGKPDVRSRFAADLRQPFGIAFYPLGPNPKYLYVANTDAVVRYPYKNGDLTATGPAEQIAELPGGGYHQHWTRTLAFSPDSKKMVVSIGSRENVGEEAAPRAAIMEYNPDGTSPRLYASGLRNAVGLGFSPVTGALWAAINERDGLGDDLVPDYATSVKPGGFYGWPYYYIGAHHDPRMPERADLAQHTITPDVLFQSHSAALSITFDTGSQFPKAYKNDIFVALHGSWNRSERTGYKVVHIPMGANGRAKGGYEDFAWGWGTPNGQVWGRPVSTAFAKDGSLLITDDGGNKIWRVAYGRGQ